MTRCVALSLLLFAPPLVAADPPGPAKEVPELAPLGPDAEGMVEQAHGFGLQVDRRRQHAALPGPGGCSFRFWRSFPP